MEIRSRDLLCMLLGAVAASVAISCSGVDRHPCAWDPPAAQTENPKDVAPGDCNADVYPSPATTSTGTP